MTSNELRQKFLEFFKEKGHLIISSAPLVPEHDPTVLFTTAGMHPLASYLLGQEYPGGKRVANVQKCIRTTDIEEVGDFTHHTFFEMLGNWSFGDYFKHEAIEWSWEFLISPQWLALDKNKLAVSVFAGDEDALFDEESFNIWKNLGVSEKRIARLPKKNNWWGPAGQTGPCGPDTEMFFWTGKDESPENFDPENPFWVEIWNDVFMQFNKTADEKFEPLARKNVDTGMGLERVLAVINGFDDNYKTELFAGIILKIEELSGKKYDDSEEVKKMMRILADHIKAAVFILAERLEPSNVERGYVLRRIIRRAVRYGKQLGIEGIFVFKIADAVFDIYKEAYLELQTNKDFIDEQLVREEEKFKETLAGGERVVEKIIKSKMEIGGKEIFNLYQSYGFPIEMTFEDLKNRGVEFNEEKLKKDFEKEMKKHQEISRVGAEQKFKGGLADHSEISTKYHTATHLLLAALRQVLGEHIFQRGSNITAERLRFDFSHPQKMLPEEIKKVEEIVNQKIQEDLPVQMQEMNLEEAMAQNAMGIFEQKYGERVKVYSIGNFSKEICGGPHVERTGALGKFKIKKEEASSAGVRRIKAVIE